MTTFGDIHRMEAVATDPDLSLAARGLFLMIILGDVEPDYRVNNAAYRASEAREALDELIEAGHVPAP